jgi:signal transduction histidine kinase
MAESLKIRLLKSVGNDLSMRAALAGMMERTRAELCGFYTARDREFIYIMLESRELSPRIGDVREKLKTTYRMFTNGVSAEEEPREKIYWRKEGAQVAYLVRGSKIESYFLVPVTFGSKVRGVLYFGSVRKEAFGRSDIAVFRRLADEGEDRGPIMFRLGGEKEILERLLEVVPQGAALVSPDGRIAAVNGSFGRILRLSGQVPETVYEVSAASSFNLGGLWEEFGILQRNISGRELRSASGPDRYLSVSWVRLEDLSEDATSLVLFSDITGWREQAEAREEMIAMVAHEIRTPLTALKSSLSILEGLNAEAEKRGARLPGGETGDHPCEPSKSGSRRFLSNAVRTVDRLGRLVDGLIDSSAARIDERQFKAEPHDVREFLESISALFIEPMRRRGIDFAIRVDETSSVLIFDRDRLEQVVQNLLANSMKHVPEDGKVSISVNRCDACADRMIPYSLFRHVGPFAFADLCVTDSGGGIPPLVADRVNTDDSSLERPARASKGLGLLIAMRLVRLHGGSLVIEEGREDGSSVHVYLPADQATARIVQGYRTVETKLDEMLASGVAPTVFCLAKSSALPWHDQAHGWRSIPLVNPKRGERSEGSVFLWPLTDRFALALSASRKLADEPDSLMAESEEISCSHEGSARDCAPSTGRAPAQAGSGLGVGWAAAPREGSSLESLLTVAVKRMEGAVSAPMMKGVPA